VPLRWWYACLITYPPRMIQEKCVLKTFSGQLVVEDFRILGGHSDGSEAEPYRCENAWVEVKFSCVEGELIF